MNFLFNFVETESHMQSSESNLSEFEQEPFVRPTLLTVLCILTFIGSGWAIATNLWGYTMASRNAEMFNKATALSKQDSSLKNDSTTRVHHKKGIVFSESIISSVTTVMTVDNLRKSALGSITSGMFTLAGALLMWWQKRKGFYIYIAGVLVGIVVPFYLYGNNLIAIGLSSFSSFFGLVFIALYALNIKSMR